MRYILRTFNIIAAKVLHCHSQLPQKLVDDSPIGMGTKKECRSETNYCWKTDTPAGIARGCGQGELGLLFSLLFGQQSDSCNTISFGDSYTGCTCHSDYCNTGTISKIELGNWKFGLIFTMMFISYISFTQPS